MPHTIKSQLIRFLLVGGVCTTLNLLLLWSLVTHAGFHYLTAATACFVVINLAGFYMNRIFSFKATHIGPGRQLAKYYAVMAASLTLNLSLMYLLVDLFSLHFLLSSMAVTLLFFAGNFLAHRFFTFS